MAATPLHLRVQYYLEERSIPFCLTGSYEVGADRPNDFDIVVYQTKDYPYSIYDMADALEVDFYYGGSVAGDSDFESYKSSIDWTSSEPEVNVILVFREEHFEYWRTATKLSKELGLHSKPHRIAMFDYWKGKADEAIERKGEGAKVAAMGSGFVPF